MVEYFLVERRGAEYPLSEGWSYPCLFYGTQVTRVRITRSYIIEP